MASKEYSYYKEHINFFIIGDSLLSNSISLCFKLCLSHSLHKKRWLYDHIYLRCEIQRRYFGIASPEMVITYAAHRGLELIDWLQKCRPPFYAASVITISGGAILQFQRSWLILLAALFLFTSCLYLHFLFWQRH